MLNIEIYFASNLPKLQNVIGYLKHAYSGAGTKVWFSDNFIDIDSIVKENFTVICPISY
jgi:hypothetical protein